VECATAASDRRHRLRAQVCDALIFQLYLRIFALSLSESPAFWNSLVAEKCKNRRSRSVKTQFALHMRMRGMTLFHRVKKRSKKPSVASCMCNGSGKATLRRRNAIFPTRGEKNVYCDML